MKAAAGPSGASGPVRVLKACSGKRPFAQGLTVKRFLPPHALGKHRFFAPDLIATKPVKPCDGGVSGAWNLLLFLQ